MPGQEIERLRSLLAHAHEQEKNTASPVQDDLAPSGSQAFDDVEPLRALLAHAHDPQKVNPIRKLVSRITEKFASPIKQPKRHRIDKDAA